MSKRHLIFLTAIFSIAASIQSLSAQDKKMEDRMMMVEMEESPHHQLMMAYRQDVANFASALKSMAENEKTFDADLARKALAEIKRSSEMMNEIHRKHSAMMGAAMQGQMNPMMEQMAADQKALIEHIHTLEKLLRSEKPNLVEIKSHADAISSKYGTMKMPKLKM